jgi:type VI secretion system FHA domain protein
MSLTLSVHTYRDAAPAQPLSRRFDRLGGALGRAADNELVLEDPGKYISRVHARVEFRDGAWCLVDVGSNPSLVNERPVGPGRHVALPDGDRITIGDYQLVASVALEAAPALPPSPLQIEPAPPRPVLSPALSAALSTIPDPLGLNLFAPAPAAPLRATESDHVSPELAAMPLFASPPAPAPLFAPPPAAVCRRLAASRSRTTTIRWRTSSSRA